MSTVVERVLEVVVQELGVDKAKASPESSLSDDLGASSEQLGKLFKAVERRFAVKVLADQAAGLASVKDLADFVSSAPVSSRVANVVVQILAVEPERVVPEASFVDDLGADSLAQTELMMEFEEVFQLGEIPEEEAQQIVTVGDAVKYVEEHTADAG